MADEEISEKEVLPEGRTRVRLDFAPEAVERLEQLKTASGAESNARVIANALRFYEWYLKTVADGGTIRIQKGEELAGIEFDWSE